MISGVIVVISPRIKKQIGSFPCHTQQAIDRKDFISVLACVYLDLGPKFKESHSYLQWHISNCRKTSGSCGFCSCFKALPICMAWLITMHVRINQTRHHNQIVEIFSLEKPTKIIFSHIFVKKYCQFFFFFT